MSFFLNHGTIFALPIIHYNMEMAAHVLEAFYELKPDCVAVELAETLQPQLLHAASRLPDISVVVTTHARDEPLYYLCEPCEATFEGLRCALENQIPSYCIDLACTAYPAMQDALPDPYSIHRIGLKNYYELYQKCPRLSVSLDKDREMHMARRLKELSLSYDKVLFIGGISHIHSILQLLQHTHFPLIEPLKGTSSELCTLTEESCREVMGEQGWFTTHYEAFRHNFIANLSNPIRPLLPSFPDRQQLILQLYKTAAKKYSTFTGNPFPGYHLPTIMKFIRNYALNSGRLLPNFYQILCGAKGCVDHNYAYEVWETATTYASLCNIDNLKELSLSIHDIWGPSKLLHFHLRQKSHKQSFLDRKRKDSAKKRFFPPSPFALCSFPPEDSRIEKFGNFLKKKAVQLLTDEAAKTLPFCGSLEDGIDVKESLRHWHQKKLFVKTRGKPLGGVGSLVVIFAEDPDKKTSSLQEKYHWQMTWLGEHAQESDMSFYATHPVEKVVGPGISRCEYGGFMMSYPPRRLLDVWTDPDYSDCLTKAEKLLKAAIDYAVKPGIVYVAALPPTSKLKNYAKRFGKKVIYVPIGHLSPLTLNQLRSFHVLDGQDKRTIADEYIY